MFKIIVSVALVSAFVVICCMFYQLSNIQVRQTKDYAVMVVEQSDIVDWEEMLSPSDKYSQLLQISEEMRKEVSEYMKKNNLKLKNGEQEFVRNNPTFEELIEDGFQFEKIEE